MAILISPSVLNSDLAHLASEIERIEGADYVHLDVMDNHFVPNLTFGLPVVEQVINHTDIPADVHLMIEDPDTWAPEYARLGAASVTFHAEASAAPIRLARELRKLGAKAGIAVKPATPVAPYLHLLEEFDLILIMTVEPGFGGQSFLDVCLPKITRMRKAISAAGLDVMLQVDGGISSSTIERAVEAGANVLVAGSAVYGAENAEQAIAQLRETGRQAAATTAED